jgi:acyl-CoA thioester hydrolase
MPYFDRARVEYLREIGQLTHLPGAPEFVMRAQHVEYHAPARFDDEVEVFVRVERLGRTSVTWAFDAYRADTGEHLVSATQVAVFVDPAERRPVEVPRGFRDGVARFEGQEVEA